MEYYNTRLCTDQNSFLCARFKSNKICAKSNFGRLDGTVVKHEPLFHLLTMPNNFHKSGNKSALGNPFKLVLNLVLNGISLMSQICLNCCGYSSNIVDIFSLTIWPNASLLMTQFNRQVPLIFTPPAEFHSIEFQTKVLCHRINLSYILGSAVTVQYMY